MDRASNPFLTRRSSTAVTEQTVGRSSLLSHATTWRKSSESGLEDTKGPLGLSTIYVPLQSVVADLIFVHGLGGGSFKTWTKDANPALFWPQAWLPEDGDFRDVRIHTFGYDSDWDKGSILNVHDFAKSLLEWIMSCPDIPLDTEVWLQVATV